MTQANSNNGKLFFKGIFTAPVYEVGAKGIPTGFGVYEDSAEQKIYFPVAGYTKKVSYYAGHKDPLVDEVLKIHKDKDRQAAIDALRSGSQTPMGLNFWLTNPDTVRIHLIDEPQNPYDKEAILVMAIIGTTRSSSPHMWFPLGYVPRSVNRLVHERMNWLKLEEAHLIVRRDKFNHLVPLVCVPYDAPPSTSSRFLNLEFD